MAPQAAPHKRGGTHRVKDRDRTNTVYDDWDYKQLKNGCIERGIYVKDMKKVEMAKTLADYDVQKRRAERSALVEHEKKQRKLEVEKRQENDRRLQEEAIKHKRRMEKEARREREESVSDDTPDEDEIRQMHDMMAGSDEGPMGQVLSEESWDSTSTDTTDSSVNDTILPECKLRLFEWSFPDMPSPTARISTRQAAIFRPKSPEYPPKRPLPVPRNIPYAPLKVHTTSTKEKLFLPGQTYPPGVNPDFVPLLSPRTRHAARNGVLSGVLRKATIERASTWAQRTQIQGWNARMFFSLAPRNETKALSDVYTKWFLENRKLLRVEPRGVGLKVTREQRHVQRHVNKGRKLAEVLEASEYRPTAVCYLPAYLDYGEEEESKERHRLENLFFVRFPGCDVPHYYFWTGEGEWADPTVRNMDWKHDGDGMERPSVSRKRLPGTSRTMLTRVKNPNIWPSPPVHVTSPPDLETIIALIEFELYTHGLAMTLIKYRNRWAKKGKADAWKTFGQHLPLIYPSGIFPTVPPPNAKSAISVAVKLAIIEKLKPGDDTMADPLRGDEPWTSKDDVWWTIDGANTTPSTEPEHEALYRRDSVPTLEFLSTDRCAGWLEQVSPSFVPLTPESLPASPELEEIEPDKWEERFLQDSSQHMDVTCPFCLLELGVMSMEEQAEHMHAHNAFGKASYRRVSSNDFLFPVYPSARRRRCSRINTRLDLVDDGADADNERTPTTEPTRLSPNSSSKKRKRVTTVTYRKKLRAWDSPR
ncbi:hypothetical protein HBI30_012800 [Parastagonospora nodorum]|nr:hypothetical protein HBI30_012800 [Parastagonospora nodorum]